MEYLAIGQLAKKTEVNIQTIRFYERQGLIPSPIRKMSGYRKYTPDYIVRIQFIKRAQKLGFPLKEIAELLSLRAAPDSTQADVKEKANERITIIEEKIKELQQMKKVLKKLVGTCDGNGLKSECPILDFLEPKE